MTTKAEISALADPEARIDALLQAMTLAEKVSLLAGSSMWYTTPIARLGIPAIKVTDGPNGARGGGSFAGGSVTSTCFPVGIALAASWNAELVDRSARHWAGRRRRKGHT
jgi:beta-glucosidase